MGHDNRVLDLAASILAVPLRKNDYGRYLMRTLSEQVLRPTR